MGSSGRYWDNAYINKTYGGKTIRGGILNPSTDDSTLAYWTVDATTIDSIWIMPDDSVQFQGKFGEFDYGTNLLSSATWIIEKTSITSFNDSTIPANNILEFYFTDLGDAVTRVYWLIFLHD